MYKQMNAKEVVHQLLAKILTISATEYVNGFEQGRKDPRGLLGTGFRVQGQ